MKRMNRRIFMKSAGTASIGSLLALTGIRNTDAATVNRVPTRPFGKTGENISMLALGGSQDLTSKQLLLKQAAKMGVTYWDTAHSYSNSEEAMGKYFAKFPNDRKNIFLVTKSSSSDSAALTDSLNTSLKRLKVDSVDMFFLHGLTNASNELTNEVKKWADSAKKKGRIRFFGFSTHKNMAKCLSVASTLGWIDGIMTSYNYRLMNRDAMKRSIDKCVNAGIGLIAMKTQAPSLARFWADIGDKNNVSQVIIDHFMKKGFTVEQAKLKAVWENHSIASICSEMTNMTILKDNVAAALDKTKLSKKEKALFALHAKQTEAYYCTGCAEHCDAVMNHELSVSDVIRCVMYAHEYGEVDRARCLLRQMPINAIHLLTDGDFSKAETVCPNNMPIKHLMNAASTLLT